MFQKKKKCDVCGYRFKPKKEEVYTAEAPIRFSADMLTEAPIRFSAVDCPVCSCQIALAFRAPRIDLPAISEQHDVDTEKSEAADE